MAEAAKVERVDNSIDHQGRTESGAKTKEQHTTAAIAAQGLHGRVIDDLDRTTKRFPEIEGRPAVPQIIGPADWTTVYDLARITDGHGVVTAMVDRASDLRHHLFRRQMRGGLYFERCPTIRSPHLNGRFSHINDQDSFWAVCFWETHAILGAKG